MLLIYFFWSNHSLTLIALLSILIVSPFGLNLMGSLLILSSILATTTDVPFLSILGMAEPGWNTKGHDLPKIVITPLDAGDFPALPRNAISKNPCPVPIPVLSSFTSNCT